MIPAACSPSTSRTAVSTASGRPRWVSTATRRVAEAPSESVTCHSISGPYGCARGRRGRPGVPTSGPEKGEVLPVAGRTGHPARAPLRARTSDGPGGRDTERRRSDAARAADHTAPPSRARPTSNCGLIITSSSPDGSSTRVSGPHSRVNEMNDTSATTRSTRRSPTSRGSTRAGSFVPARPPADRPAAPRPADPPDVDGVHLQTAALQQHLGEPAADAPASSARPPGRYPQVVQGAEQLVRGPRTRSGPARR